MCNYEVRRQHLQWTRKVVCTLAPMWVSFKRFIVSMTYCKAACHARATRVDDSKTRATASRCGGSSDAMHMVVYVERELVYYKLRISIMYSCQCIKSIQSPSVYKSTACATAITASNRLEECKRYHCYEECPPSKWHGGMSSTSSRSRSTAVYA